MGLCVKLHKWLTDNERIDGAELEAKIAAVESNIRSGCGACKRSQSNFKRVLLNQCQSSFEQCPAVLELMAQHPGKHWLCKVPRAARRL